MAFIVAKGRVVSFVLYWAICMAVFCCCQSSVGQSVYKQEVRPNWFANNSRFWYQNELPGQRREFVLFDTATGDRSPAFDHERLAQLLSEKTKRKFIPARLNVSDFKFTDDLGGVEFSAAAKRWRLNLKTYELSSASDSEPDNENAARLFKPGRPSANRSGETEIIVDNHLEADVEMFWVDRSGNHQGYGVISPGASRRQHTFVGHVWLFKSKDRELGFLQAENSGNRLKLDEKSIQNVGRKKRRISRASTNRSAQPGNRRRSPDGRWTAIARDHNLLIRSDAETVTLSETGTDAFSFQNRSPTTANVYWSPDSKHLVAFQTEQVDTPRVQIVESTPKKGGKPRIQSYGYARAGDRLKRSFPQTFSVESRKQVQPKFAGTSLEELPIDIRSAPPEIALPSGEILNPYYIRFLRWSEDSSKYWFFYNARGHQSLKVFEVSLKDGSVRTLVDEASETFIQYSDPGKFVLEWLPDNKLLWASERSGWNHLYTYNVDDPSEISQITTGDWNVRRIDQIDREKKQIWFYAVGVHEGQDPYHEHYCRVNFDGSGLTLLTDGDGTQSVKFSPDRRFLLVKYSRVDLPPISEVRDAQTGKLVGRLEAADASEILAQRSFPQRFKAKGRDGKTDIWGIIHRPKNFDPTKSYPVVENIYAGPHDHHVPKRFRTRYFNQQNIANRGMIVVQIDGMGTAWRSKAFHDVCHQNLRDAGFPDRIAWLKAAAKEHPELDLTRVGIFGGSAGGQNAMAALLWHNDFYKVAVADCGCHDNRMDKVWWNEQWMGENDDVVYSRNSNRDNAHLLKGKLMLVVGELDRNVDPSSTIQVVKKLIDANKDFEFVLVPGVGHGACETPWASRKRTNFLAKHLNAEAQ